jgi:hypothetical protein
VVRPSTLRSTANDGEAVPIKICKLIKAWFIQDGLGVICRNGTQIIVEIGARWADHTREAMTAEEYLNRLHSAGFSAMFASVVERSPGKSSPWQPPED